MCRDELRLASCCSNASNSKGASWDVRFQTGATADCSQDSNASSSPTAQRKHDAQLRAQGC
eukprot:6653682-Pyramimonas_sp.AAC.1